MSNKVVGTFYVDGLLQGRAPGDEAFQKSIDSWIAAAGANGLLFSFNRDGSNFTLLPGDEIRKSSTFGAISVQDALRDAFQQFLEFFPVEERMHLLSTLRSVEYRPNAEVQTIYAVVPPGKVEVQERTIDARTVEPEPVLTREGKIKLTLIAVGCALLFAGLLFLLAKTFFPEWLEEKQDQISFASADKITIDGKNFEGFLTFKKGALDRSKGTLEGTLIRGERWQEAIDSSKPGEAAWNDFLAIQAIKRGRLRIEFYGLKDEYIGAGDLPIGNLLKKEEVSAALALPRQQKVHRIKLTY